MPVNKSSVAKNGIRKNGDTEIGNSINELSPRFPNE